MSAYSRVLIVIPTYNEAENITELIEQLCHEYPGVHILIVDDNSPDGTGVLVQHLCERRSDILLLSSERKQGLGKAYRTAFNHIVTSLPRYEYVVQMDADFSHSPHVITDLLAQARDSDLVIGSRYIQGGRDYERSFVRRVLTSVLRWMIKNGLHVTVFDPSSGFRCFKRAVLEGVDLDGFCATSYLFQVEMVTQCMRCGYNIAEVPIVFNNRTKGCSKVTIQELLSSLGDFCKLLIRQYC